jgi:hypothetical protein
LAVVVLQVFILDALVNYQVQDSKDAEKIVERVLPRLQHVNSAVVLSAAKVRMAAMGNVRVSMPAGWWLPDSVNRRVHADAQAAQEQLGVCCA